MSKRRKQLPAPSRAVIETLSHDGRGITHVNGKVVFIHRALPGETVLFRYTQSRSNYAEGDALEIIQASPQRIEPGCSHFAQCGGCSLQHLSQDDQISVKQQRLFDSLERIGHVSPENRLAPLSAENWGYRRKARLGVKYVRREQVVCVGFRERSSAFLTDVKRCPVLHPRIGERIDDLAGLIGSLSIKDKVPQIEIAVGDDDAALVIRHLAPPSEADYALLRAFGQDFSLQLYLQSGGPKTVVRLWPDATAAANPLGYPLSYRLPDEALEIQFQPTDFTQVNASINQIMVARALALLAPNKDERVLDLFCGLGNFSLPLARRAGSVVGVEGEPSLVERARANARHNGIENVDFYSADLSGDLSNEPWYGAGFDKLLLDPPRSGAAAVVTNLPQPLPSRIVYVSCDPATLARDANILVSQHGYHLHAAGIIDMFPHTAHVESIAVFVRPDKHHGS